MYFGVKFDFTIEIAKSRASHAWNRTSLWVVAGTVRLAKMLSLVPAARPNSKQLCIMMQCNIEIALHLPEYNNRLNYLEDFRLTPYETSSACSQIN